MSMDNDLYIAPLNMAGHSSTVIDHEITQKPLLHCYSFDLNNQNHIINGIPMLSGEQCEPLINVHVGGGGGSFINSASIGDTNSFVTSQQGKNIVGEASNHIGNSEFHEHLAGGTSSTPASLAAILAARIGLQENLENSENLSPSVGSFEALGSYVFNNWQDNSNPLSANFGNRGGYVESGNGKWNVVNKFLKAPEVDGAGFLPYSSIGNIDHNGWTSLSVANLANHAYNSSNYSNELSLSLATSPTAGQCSEMSGSDVSCSMNETRTGLEKASCSSSKELSMNLGSDKHVRFSPTILGSKYLVGIQEILAQIAAYSFENLEEVNFSAAGARAGVKKSASAFTSKRRVVTNQSENSMFEGHSESPSHKHVTESNKSQLLTLLQLVDDRYSQCLDEIHTVVSAFHAATELDPHIHAHFALRTISLLYKDLRERISSHILAMGSNFNESCSEEKEWPFDTSFIQKQWALQQLKRKDQLWRPQRGLPERSVSVLRAWMFQNFLHPYPKDAEKHLLAVKSGLTRSQVSNWFINARVRLWKPMIEEMYAEMNRRKACRNEEGIESSHRSRICLNNQMLNMN